MRSKYKIRRAGSPDDAKKLHDHFNYIFHSEVVGTLAETIFAHLPGMENKYWFMAVDEDSSEIASAFALIPWTWEVEGLKLKVAEMGIVGTRERHRNKGLMAILNKEFDATLEEEGFDLAVVQGIPGFYRRFGFHYSIPLENHIDIPLHLVPHMAADETYKFRLAETEDISFLVREDERYKKSNFLSVFRDEANWNYLLTYSQKTEYGSEFWIMEDQKTEQMYYFRIPYEGFGEGLIVSEISECISDNAIINLLKFCKKKAVERKKPYIRLNVHNESIAGKTAISFGALSGRPYAWQIKIPDKTKFLDKIAPILETRMKGSSFADFSGILRLDLYTRQIDLNWCEGRLESVAYGCEEDCENTLCLSEDLFAALCLGHRTWRELQYNRPDIFPAMQYTGSGVGGASDKTARLIDTLFPAERSWIYEQY